MKMVATITVEFQSNAGMPQSVLEAALQRGLGELRIGIEHGTGSMPTNIKRGSTKTVVVDTKVT
jgi:hypothetical protein